MIDADALTTQLTPLAWPLALLVAWVAGELCERVGVPRISTYAVVGILAAPFQFGWLEPLPELEFLADLALGLFLFELSYRVNLRWFANNRWLGIGGLADATLSFAAIFALSRWLGLELPEAALLGALGMASSPAALVRVLHDEQAEGQIAERVLHLALLGCVLAAIVLELVMSAWMYTNGVHVVEVAYLGAFWVLLSSGLGVLFGLALTATLRAIQTVPDATMPHVLAVVCLVATSHALDLSPIVATLALGLTTRHRRVVFGRTRRGFGPLGDLAALLLFVYMGSQLDLAHAGTGLAIGLGIVAVRALVSPAVLAATAPLSGISVRKGALTGLGLMPLSAFALMLLEHSSGASVDLLARLAPLAAAALVLDIVGPLCTRLALRWGGEVSR